MVRMVLISFIAEVILAGVIYAFFRFLGHVFRIIGAVDANEYAGRIQNNRFASIRRFTF